MTSIFRRIDDFLFDRVFQPIVDRFPDQGPVGVARFFVTGSMIGFAISASTDAVAHKWMDSVLVDLPWVVYGGIDYTMIGRIRVRLGARNPLRLKLGVGRFILAAGALIGSLVQSLDPSFGHVFYVIGFYLYLSFEYAAACDVHPPKTRKAPFWQSWFQTAPQGA